MLPRQISTPELKIQPRLLIGLFFPLPRSKWFAWEREKIKASLSWTFGLLPELCESWFWLVLPVPLLPVWRSLEIPIGHSPDSLRSLGFVVVIYLFIFLRWTYIVRCVPNIKSGLGCCLHCRLRMLRRLFPKQSIFLRPKMGGGRRGSLIYIWMLWVSCLPWSCV